MLRTPWLLPALACLRLAVAAVWRVPADYSTIDGALDHAQAGDSVLVAPGVYHEHNLTISDDALTLTADEPEAFSTIIDGDGQRILSVTGADGALVQGLVLRNGVTSGNGGGMSVSGSLAVRMRDCRFEACGADDFGGGLFLAEGSSAVLRDCVFAANASPGDEGSALSLWGEALLIGCVVEDQTGTIWSSALHKIRAASLTAIGCEFSSNATRILSLGGTGPCTFEDCLFSANATSGILISTGTVNGSDHATTLTGCRLDDNQADVLLSGRLRLEGCSLRGNAVTHSLAVGDTLRFIDCLVANSEGLGGFGDNLLEARRRLVIEGATLAFNRAAGALLQSNQDVDVNRSLLVCNAADLLLRGQYASPPALSVSCTGQYGNLARGEGTDWSGAFAPFEGREGNWRTDPRLRDPNLGDYRPARGSPALPDPLGCDVLGGALAGVDEEPAPLAWFSANPAGGAAPLTVNLRAWPGEVGQSWGWDLDDDDQAELAGAQVEHVFMEFGAWPATLIATGDGQERRLRLPAAVRVGGRVLRVPQDYPTPASALAAALPYDTVELACGDYPIDEALVLRDAVTLRAAELRCARLIQLGTYWDLLLGVQDQIEPCRLEGLVLRGRQGGSMLDCSNARLELRDCRLVGGSTILEGSGLALISCDVDSMGHVLDFGEAELVDCRLRDCGSLASAQGGDPRLVLENCVVERCERLVYGIPWQSDGHLTLHGCTLAECGLSGATLVDGWLEGLELDRCVLAASRSPLLGAAGEVPDELVLTRTDIFGTLGGDWSGPLAPYQDQDGNLSADPLFCDAGAGDYHLAAHSPCRLDSLGQDQMGAFGVGCAHARPWIISLDVEELDGPLPLVLSITARTMGEIVTWNWDAQGDGEPEGDLPAFTWSYDAPGLYRLRLEVAGPDGGTAALDTLIRAGFQFFHVPDSFPTLAAALAQAQDGDLVLVAAGTYFEHDLEAGAGVSLCGEGAGAVIDAQGLGRVLTLQAGQHPALLQGLTLRNGSAPAGAALGAVAVGQPPAPLVVRRCAFSGNRATAEGGAISWGAGLPDLELDSCRFEGNQAVQGGALAGAGFRLRHCRFLGNQAQEGGAVWKLDSLALEDCEFTGNSAERGGALHLDGATRLDGCLFQGNRATERGGAVWNAPWVAAIGARYQDCLFVGNRAGLDGAALCDASGPALVACTVAGDSTADTGAALSLPTGGGGPGPRLEGCIVAGTPGGRALACADERLLISCSDFWGNAHGDWSPPFAGQLGQRGNLQADPLFCRPQEGDYSLGLDSPCRPEQTLCGWMGARRGPCQDLALKPLPTRPAALCLGTPSPNPFNGAAWVAFELPRAGAARLVLYNLRGQRVAVLLDESLAAGRHRRRLDARGLASGLYLLSLEAGGVRDTQKVLLVQ